jgi:hypothetical protein
MEESRAHYRGLVGQGIVDGPTKMESADTAGALERPFPSNASVLEPASNRSKNRIDARLILASSSSAHVKIRGKND